MKLRMIFLAAMVIGVTADHAREGDQRQQEQEKKFLSTGLVIGRDNNDDLAQRHLQNKNKVRTVGG